MKRMIIWVLLFTMLFSVGCAKQDAPPQQRTESSTEQSVASGNNAATDGEPIYKIETSVPAQTTTFENSTDKTDDGKKIISISASYAQFRYEDLVNNPGPIILGKVVKQTQQYFTAPNGDEKLASGKKAKNVQVTEYELEIKRLIKGEYDKDTILVKVYNGSQLTPKQFLYGEDENAKVVTNIPTYYLEVGQEYLLGLYYFERFKYKDGEAGYNISQSSSGLFVKQENGLYKNSNHPKKFEVDIEKLAEDCQKLKEK